MRKPNFLIIGAARAGTTTLNQCLRLHPEIYLAASDSEPKFFCREQEYMKGEKYYLNKYFSNTQGYKAIGEKSTEYMENSSAADRICDFNPDMKLLCMLRDPVERTISNYWWSLSNRLEERSINDALRLEWEKYIRKPERITKLNSARPCAYIDRSLYYDNLLPFYGKFPKGNIRCVIFEEFVNNQKKVVESLFSFLGVRALDLPLDSVAVERSVERKQTIDPVLYKGLAVFFREKNSKLSELIAVDVNTYWYKGS